MAIDSTKSSSNTQTQTANESQPQTSRLARTASVRQDVPNVLADRFSRAQPNNQNSNQVKNLPAQSNRQANIQRHAMNFLSSRIARNNPDLSNRIRRFVSQADSENPRMSRQDMRTLVRARHQGAEVRRFAQIAIRHERAARNMARAQSSTSTQQSGTPNSSQAGQIWKSDQAAKTYSERVREILEGKRQMPGGSEGKKFQGKTTAQWQAFFQNLKAKGHTEQIVKRNISQFVEGQFRGQMANTSNQKLTTLIADLVFNTPKGQVEAEKFTRLVLENPTLAAQLANLKPGDKLTPEMLKKFGQELSLVKMAQHSEGPNPKSAQDLLQQLKNPMGNENNRSIEQAMFENRQRKIENDKMNEKQKLGLAKLSDEEKAAGLFSTPFWYAGPRGAKNNSWFGKPKKWLFVSSAFLAIVGAIVFYAFIRGLF